MKMKIRWKNDSQGQLSGKISFCDYRYDSHKICFPARGAESSVCFHHAQECALVRDTQPGQRKGALIVRPMPCEACERLRELLTLCGPGWVAKGGRLVAPDGEVESLDLHREIYAGAVALAQKSYSRRERVRALKLFIAENADTFSAIPLPDGEPTIPVKPEFSEPPEFRELQTEKGLAIAVHPTRGIGFAAKCR